MKTLSLDLRQRIVACCDEGTATQREIAERFCVSLPMVKKLLAQRRKRGDIAPIQRRQSRQSMFTEEVRVRLREFLAADPSMTLAELRAALGMSCSLPALHYVLKEMDLTFRGSSARRRARVAPAAEAERVELAASARGDETLADTNVAVATSPPKAKASKVSKASKAPSPGASAPVSAPGSRRKGGGKRV